MKYAIGDVIWRVSASTKDMWAICPDCGGEGRIRCIMHDETIVSVDCEGCGRGSETPPGHIRYYAWSAEAVTEAIVGFRVEDGRTEYRTPQCYGCAEADLFNTEAEALAEAERKSEQHNKDEIARISMKEKDTRSWSWNASYHRREIKEAQRRIEYHTAKLSVASLKAKEKTP